MKWKEIILFWLVSLLLVIGFVGLIRDILLPFVVAMIAAYFLDPIADRLERFGLSRMSATLVIVSVFFTLVIVLSALLIPVLYDQSVALAQNIPLYSVWFHEKATPLIDKYLGSIDNSSLENAKAAIGNVSGGIITFVTKILGNVLRSTLAVVNLLLLIFITPVVTFYFLRDWDKMVVKIHSWLPPAHEGVVVEQAKLIDRALSGYIRGQTNVCLILGTYYAIGLTVVGLDFGLFIGLGAGILAFIPYVGVLFGLVVGLIVAFFQFGDSLHMGLVVGVFAVGQFIEGNFITPKLVGDKVGLHPVWIIFGMLAGAALFGFVGVLLAVPVTAIIGVLVRFALDKYLKSPFYCLQISPSIKQE